MSEHEEQLQMQADAGAREVRRYYDCLCAEGFNHEDAVRLVVAWQSRAAGMAPEQLERLLLTMREGMA